jgi:leader peptidase (prepilin peptidase) / N-methyltransferase
MGIDAIFNAHNWQVVPFHFWSICLFTLGCMVGSFLNVCIYRMPLELSVVSPPSHCPHCKYSIPFYLNIPLVTWLALRGRCKNCAAPISPRYFIVELLTGLAFLACWLAYGNHQSPLPTLPIALAYAVFMAGLICATFIDFEHFIIPDEITLGGIVLGFAASLMLPALHDADSFRLGLWRSALGIVIGAGIIYAILRLGKLLFGRQKIALIPGTKIYFTENAVCLPEQVIPYEELFYRKSDTIVVQAQTVELVDRGYRDVTLRLSPAMLRIDDEEINPEAVTHLEAVCSEVTLPREAMGLGDVKFMGAIGAFIGWQGAVFSLMVSSMIGAAVGIVLIALRRREWSSRLPYGPYIAAAAIIWLFGGKKLFYSLFAIQV